MLRKLDNPLSCVKKVGIREADHKPVEKFEHEKPVFEEIINSLRYANSRMLGIQCTPLETLTPIAGEPEKGKHYDRLVTFLNRVRAPHWLMVATDLVSETTGWK